MSALPVLRESYKTVAVPSVFRLEERSGGERERERCWLKRERKKLNSGYNTLVTEKRSRWVYEDCLPWPGWPWYYSRVFTCLLEE